MFFLPDYKKIGEKHHYLRFKIELCHPMKIMLCIIEKNHYYRTLLANKYQQASGPRKTFLRLGKHFEKTLR